MTIQRRSGEMNGEPPRSYRRLPTTGGPRNYREDVEAGRELLADIRQGKF